MPKPKRLPAREILRVFRIFGFTVVSTRGGRAKLRRETAGHPPRVLTVPLPRELAAGTVQAIWRQALRFRPEEELRPRFYAGA